MRSIAILGSTGSIGTQTLETIDSLNRLAVGGLAVGGLAVGKFSINGLTANENIDLLEQQIYKYAPKKAAVMNENKAWELKKRLRAYNTEILAGMDGLMEIAAMDGVDTVVTSLVGNIGIAPTFAAMEAGKDIALANKETLVSAGKLVMETAARKKINIYPVDSEHSAIFQCLQGNSQNKISRILLTASGGPFRGYSREKLGNIVVKDALKHPNWSMGKKITIDSATLMNKGLEVMEAKWLFSVESSQIEVLVHPQSIVHSAVEFEDGSVIAQMGEPDMRVPIQYALTYPHRLPNSFPKIDFNKRSNLTFEKPDMEAFPCLALAYRAMEIGATMPTVLNAANEVAVSLFLAEKIGFLDIPMLIEKTMNAYTIKCDFDLTDLLAADKWARAFTKGL